MVTRTRKAFIGYKIQAYEAQMSASNFDKSFQGAINPDRASMLHEAAQTFLQANPCLRVVFALNAEGRFIKTGCTPSTSAFLDHIDTVCAGFSDSCSVEELSIVQQSARDSGRDVSEHNRFGVNKMVIAPAMLSRKGEHSL